MSDNGHQAEAPRFMPQSAGVVVIGGGVNGLSTAYQLAKRGARDVIVLEQKWLGAGASGKTGALVRCHYANPHEAELTHKAMHIFRNWDDEIGAGSSGFSPVGFIQVVAPDQEAKLRANVADQQALGIQTSIVDKQELREIEPFLNTDDLTYGAYEPGSGYADPNATLQGFARAARDLGVRIFENTPVTAVKVEGGKVTGVETPFGTIATDRVVIAAGSWAGRLLAPLGFTVPQSASRTQVVLFRQPPRLEARGHCVVIDAINHAWMRPEGGNCTLIGAERDVYDANPDDFDESIDARTIAPSRKALAARFPIFEQSVMRGGWSGTYLRSPDGHPIIDRVPGVDGAWMMTGDSGTSFKTSPAIGVCLAEWVCDGSVSLVDITPFRATRFADNQPWLDANSYGDDRTLTVSR
ncbi:MAG: FAD-binding oxidoreductase [Thermomicrobiales bacterium]